MITVCEDCEGTKVGGAGSAVGDSREGFLEEECLN